MVRFNRTLNADSLPFTLTSEWHNCTFISNSKVLCVHCKRPFFFQSLIELWIKATYFRVNNHANFMPMWNFSQEQLLINLKLCHGIYCISMLRGSVIRCHQESGWTFVLSTNAAWDNFHFKAAVEGFLQSNETIKCQGTFDTDYLQPCSLYSVTVSMHSKPVYTSGIHKQMTNSKDVSAWALIRTVLNSTEHFNQVLSPSLIELSCVSKWSAHGLFEFFNHTLIDHFAPSLGPEGWSTTDVGHITSSMPLRWQSLQAYTWKTS